MVQYPAWDRYLDPEMFLIGELEYAGRYELAEAVLWAIENAAGSDQPTPAGVSVAGL